MKSHVWSKTLKILEFLTKNQLICMRNSSIDQQQQVARPLQWLRSREIKKRAMTISSLGYRISLFFKKIGILNKFLLKFKNLNGHLLWTRVGNGVGQEKRTRTMHVTGQIQRKRTSANVVDRLGKANDLSREYARGMVYNIKAAVA